MLLLAASLQGQFGSLAVTDEGWQVYFVTTLRSKGEAADSRTMPGRPAVYRFKGGGLERLTTPPSYVFPNESDGTPQVSGDGSIYSYTHSYVCNGGSSCINRPSTSTTILTVRGGATQTLSGLARISRNGRYVVHWEPAIRITIPPRPATNRLLDLQTGVSVDLPIEPGSAPESVTSDGHVLAVDAANRLVLWAPESVRTPAVKGTPRAAIVNDRRTWVVYRTDTELRSQELAGGLDVRLGDGSPFFSISDDGREVLYLADRELWLVRPDGTDRRRLTDDPDGVDEAVLAGDGRSVIAIMGGRLVKIDTATGAVQELIARTPVCPYSLTLAPGSAFRIVGRGLAPPVVLNGSPLPLLSVSASEIWAHLPFGTPLDSGTIPVESSSVFRACTEIPVTIRERAPEFITLAHEGFRGPVTDTDPARPGEILTAYAIGLGAVTPPGADQLRRLAAPFECHAGPWGEPEVPLLFAGLAPGMFGVYQVTFRAPDTGWVQCGSPGVESERTWLYIPFPH